VRSALTRYRALAWATGVFLILLTVHVLVQWQQSSSQGIAYGDAPGLGQWIPGADRFVPLVHGYLYLVYVIVAVDLWFRARLPVGRTVLVVLAGTVPLMSFIAERWVTSRVRPLLDAPVVAPAPDPAASTG
jgi:integral membrane protein